MPTPPEGTIFPKLPEEEIVWGSCTAMMTGCRCFNCFCLAPALLKSSTDEDGENNKQFLCEEHGGYPTIRLYCDDVRDPPDSSWMVSRSAEDALAWLETGIVSWASLDHDLGMKQVGKAGGYITYEEDKLAKDGTWLANQMVEKGIKPPKITVHSMNPVGAKRMREILGVK